MKRPPPPRLPALAGVVFLTLIITTCLWGDPSMDKMRECRANLKMLTEALTKFVHENTMDLPVWMPYDQAYTMVLTGKYVPVQPKLPTLDCSYNLILKTRDEWSWYCNLHGALSGDKTITFSYHEFRFSAFVQTKFLFHNKYKLHQDELLRWQSYVPTLTESIKNQYSKNPSTTIVLVCILLGSLYFIYRNMND